MKVKIGEDFLVVLHVQVVVLGSDVVTFGTVITAAGVETMSLEGKDVRP